MEALDNKPGVDTNHEPGKVEFAGHPFQSDAISGTFSGEAEVAEGKLKDWTYPAEQ